MSYITVDLPHTGKSLTRAQVLGNVKHLVSMDLGDLRTFQSQLQAEMTVLSYRSINHDDAGVRAKADRDLVLAQRTFEATVDAVMIKIS